jgi:hypothetical protein
MLGGMLLGLRCFWRGLVFCPACGVCNEPAFTSWLRMPFCCESTSNVPSSTILPSSKTHTRSEEAKVLMWCATTMTVTREHIIVWFSDANTSCSVAVSSAEVAYAQVTGSKVC